jgi:hypothetical protein
MQTTMNILSLRRLATQVLVVTVAMAAVLTSGAPAQSLGDVARQEESRRKGTGTGKVYTNGDLRSAPAPASSPAPPVPSASVPGSTPAAPADATKPAGTKPTDGTAKAGGAPAAGTAPGDAKPARGASEDAKADAASWRKRRQDIETAIERSKTFAEALQSRINGLNTDFTARDDPAQRASVAADRQKALTELDRVKKEITQNTKALADLQEEARRSGVPPGWLR